ncbi:2Fe-2S iron-sulfur cluster-binding protein [Streptomyces sp. NPDC050698]
MRVPARATGLGCRGGGCGACLWAVEPAWWRQRETRTAMRAGVLRPGCLRGGWRSGS